MIASAKCTAQYLYLTVYVMFVGFVKRNIQQMIGHERTLCMTNVSEYNLFSNSYKVGIASENAGEKTSEKTWTHKYLPIGIRMYPIFAHDLDNREKGV